MRWIPFWFLCALLVGCDSSNGVNKRAYVITQTQFEETDSEAPTSMLEEK
jgi:hypothetical protein